MPTGRIPGRLNTNLTIPQATCKNTYAIYSASFSRVRWQFPSPRKLYKL